MIAQRMGILGVKPNYDEIFADAAEPKSIDEICAYGYNVKPAPKGPGSVEYGHQRVGNINNSGLKTRLGELKSRETLDILPIRMAS